MDYVLDLLYPGKDYLENSQYPELLGDLSYQAQSEIGEDDDKVEVSFSVLSMVKALVNGGGLTFRLITTNILE